MNTVYVGNIKFLFSPRVSADKYDDWQHVNRFWMKRNTKKIDVIVASIEPGETWLLEVKDFRIVTDPPNASNLSDLPGTVIQKAIHTLEGLEETSVNGMVQSEKNLSFLFLRPGQNITLVLHLEPSAIPDSPLFFSKSYYLSVFQKLTQLKTRCPRITSFIIVHLTNPNHDLPWTATSI